MIYLGADHGGFELKDKIAHRLANRGVVFEDFGTFSKEAVDYPAYAKQVVKAVLRHDGKGILFCRSGQGMAICANRYKGIRAITAWKSEIATIGRSHNNANILSLPADYLSEEEAWEIITAFLSTQFSRDARHERRNHQLEELR
jgi:ribose 5-phosphate isomerase B